MSQKSRQAEVDAVDEFLAGRKTLKGGHPDWFKNTRGELEAIWTIIDENGVESGQLRFTCSRPYRANPSVSVIFRGNPVWRFDLVDATEGKPNPPGAADLGLLGWVYGNHQHAWPDNRSHVLNGIWDLPFRREASKALYKISQAYQALAAEINLELQHDQFSFEVPPFAELI